MSNQINYYSRKMEFHGFVLKAYPDLVRFKKESDSESFNALFLQILPEVKKYVDRRLAVAQTKGQIGKNKYRAEDFIDQLFIDAYDHIDKLENAEELHLWLFKKVDELLADVLIEEEFDSIFFENIDNYSKPEWDEMVEKFSTDGGGDLVMIEELDDISYGNAKSDYLQNHVFQEDTDDDLIAKLDKELDQENLRKHVQLVLHHLPASMRRVYELSTEHHFSVSQIATIRSISEKEVKELLERAKRSLRTSFLGRYKD